MKYLPNRRKKSNGTTTVIRAAAIYKLYNAT